MIDGKTFWGWMWTPFFNVGSTTIDAENIVGLFVIIFAAWWVSARIENAIRRVAAQRSTSTGSIYAWARVVRYTLWVLATLIGLNSIGINLASFAVVGGALGVGIGFGLQNIFSNFFSGVILLLEKTLKEGDFVDLQSGTRGHVREIGLRYTRNTTNDDVDVIVPNSEFINGRVVNWTHGDSYRRIHIPFGVAYGSDKAVVKSAALQAADAIPATLRGDGRDPDVWLVELADSSLNFELVVWVGAAATTAPARTDALYKWAIHDALIEAGLEIPFPKRDLYLKTEELNVRVIDGHAGGAT